MPRGTVGSARGFMGGSSSPESASPADPCQGLADGEDRDALRLGGEVTAVFGDEGVRTTLDSGREVERVRRTEGGRRAEVGRGLDDGHVDRGDLQVGEGLEDLAVAATQVLAAVALRGDQHLEAPENGGQEAAAAVLGCLQEGPGCGSEGRIVLEVVDENHRVDGEEGRPRHLPGWRPLRPLGGAHRQESRSAPMAAAPPPSARQTSAPRPRVLSVQPPRAECNTTRPSSMVR